MANTDEHRYSVSVTWSGNLGSGTSGYRDYSRDYEIGADGKAVIPGSRGPGRSRRWPLLEPDFLPMVKGKLGEAVTSPAYRFD